MPLYDYACTKCGRVHEVRHGFNESYQRPCEACGAELRRVFNPAPILFKGTGFYATDSRRSKGDGKPEKAKEASETAKSESSETGDSKAGSKAGSKSAESAA